MQTTSLIWEPHAFGGEKIGSITGPSSNMFERADGQN